MSTPGPLNARQPQLRIPEGEVIGSFPTYLEAQQMVDHLAKGDFPVAEVSILGRDLTTVERVTRKLSWNRAALAGALSGAWFGVFVGMLIFLVSTTGDLSLVLAAVLIGAAAGLVFRLVTYGAARRNRDFQSTSQVLAASYDVLVPNGHAARARDVLARPLPED